MVNDIPYIANYDYLNFRLLIIVDVHDDYYFLFYSNKADYYLDNIIFFTYIFLTHLYVLLFHNSKVHDMHVFHFKSYNNFLDLLRDNGQTSNEIMLSFSSNNKACTILQFFFLFRLVTNSSTIV